MGDGLLYHPAHKDTNVKNPSGTPVPLHPLPPDEKDGVAYFVDCIRNNKPIEDPSSAELNVGVNEIIDAAIESISTGRAVSLNP